MNCRLCGGVPKRFLSLGSTPLANNYVRDQPEYPLNLESCSVCGHVQLDRVVDRSLFRDYAYSSKTFLKDHFAAYAKQIWSCYRPRSIVDIGCGDGGFLEQFRCTTVGVDPCIKLLEKANIDLAVEGFFDVDVAETIRREHGRVSVATANNVFAHLESIDAFMDGIDVLAPDVFIFEVSYWPDIVRKRLFDTIYHEHVDYFSLEPLATYLDERGYGIIWLDHLDTQGGSIRVHAAKESGMRIFWEDVPDSQKIINAVKALKADCRRMLDGRKMPAFGAPAKATTLMRLLDIRPTYVVDDSPLKQGKVMPGTDIPIVSELEDDEYILFAWNYPEIVKRFPGKRAFIPLPEPRFV